jgi:hypothetical protein
MNQVNLEFDLELIVPTNIIEQIRDRKVILALDYLGEAFTHVIREIYINLVDRQNIPASQILLIEHSPDISERILNYCNNNNQEPIKYEVFYMLEKMIQRAVLIEMGLDTGYNKPVFSKIKSPMLNSTFSKKFIFLNRIWRRHRTMMLLLLNDNDLLKHSFTSFHNMGSWDFHIDNPVLDKYSEFQDIVHRNRHIGNQLPLVLDTPVFEPDINKFRRNMIKLYNDTYFSLVSETVYDEGIPFFPTEKVFKPIMHKHPFVVISTPHFLKKLREMGYKTFDGIIDESYDDIIDGNQRMLAIVKEVKRLCNLNDDELLEFRTKALEIVEHNYNILISKESFLTKLL